MGDSDYAPAISAADEDEQRRYLLAADPAKFAAGYSGPGTAAPAPAAPGPDTSAPPYAPVEPLGARSGEPSLAVTPVMPSMAGPSSEAFRTRTRAQESLDYPPVGIAVSGHRPTPAESRLNELTAKGAPPVEPLHGWKKALDIVGQIARPDIEQRIRYAPQHRYAANLAAAQSDLSAETTAETEPFKVQEAANTAREKGAKASQEEAKAEQERNAIENPKESWKVVPGVAGPNGALLQEEATSGQLRWAPGITGAGPVKPPADTATQNKETFQHTVGVLRGEGLLGPGDVTDYKKISAAIQNSKQLNDAEKNAAVGYLAANPTPGTNLQVHVAGTQAQEKIRNKDKYYSYTDANGETQIASGDKVPADAEGVVPIKDPEQLMSSAHNTNLVQKSFNQLASHDVKMFDDPKVRAVLATALDEHAARSVGLLVAGTGGSLTLPAGTGKIIDQFLQNNAVPKQYEREVKDFIVDYYSMKDKLITLQMDIQNGKMGRAALPMIQAMFSQMPGLASADSTMAKRQLTNLQGFLSGVKEKFPEKYGNYTKEPDFRFQEEGGGGKQPIYAVNPQTKERVVSNDGGKTWQPANK
jgi:hypothetical protein